MERYRTVPDAVKMWNRFTFLISVPLLVVAGMFAYRAETSTSTMAALDYIVPSVIFMFLVPAWVFAVAAYEAGLRKPVLGRTLSVLGFVCVTGGLVTGFGIAGFAW